MELAPCSEDLEGSGLISAYIQPHLAANPYCHLDDSFAVTVAGKSIEFRVTAVDAKGEGGRKGGEAPGGPAYLAPTRFPVPWTPRAR